MMNLLLSFILLSSADISGLLRAKKPEQILQWHQRDEEVSILKQRCEAEVQGAFFPTNCFLWSQKAKLGPREKLFFQGWFETVCIKALKEDITQARFHLNSLGKVRGACRQQLVQSAQNWLYKVKKEGDEHFFQRLKVGKEIEMILAHETLAKRKPNKLSVIRTPGRRLN